MTGLGTSVVNVASTTISYLSATSIGMTENVYDTDSYCKKASTKSPGDSRNIVVLNELWLNFISCKG